MSYEEHDYGRILVGWDPSIWSISVHSKSPQQITCFATFLEKQITFCATFIYALNKDHQREPLWHDIVSLSHLISIPWCVTGDFNYLLALNEAKGGRDHWTPAMQSFKDCVFDASLGHIKMIGPLFTWTNKRLSYLIQRRLDRMLCNKEWFNNFGDSFVLVKNREIMDHCRLLCSVHLQLEKITSLFSFSTI